VNEYVFFAGRRLARIDSSGNVYYYQADQIGSTRTIVTASGTLCYDADFTPYGEELLPTGTNTCPQNYKFAGYERDAETGLDYAFNRYYNSRIGRFMVPDPPGIKSAQLSNPQSLNLYPYVLNNPLTNVDPTGLDTYLIQAAGCAWHVTSWGADSGKVSIGPSGVLQAPLGSDVVFDWEVIGCYPSQPGQNAPQYAADNPSAWASIALWNSNLNPSSANTNPPCTNIAGHNICPVKYKNSPMAAGRRSLSDPFCSIGMMIPQVTAPYLTTNPFTVTAPNPPLPAVGFLGCEEDISTDPFFNRPPNSGDNGGGS
jgi:RHS repeat-associated protein